MYDVNGSGTDTSNLRHVACVECQPMPVQALCGAKIGPDEPWESGLPIDNKDCVVCLDIARSGCPNCGAGHLS
jgi:hypothetical protein